MAFTGQAFSDQIDITSDLAYGTYFDPAKKNALIKEALIKMCSLKYATLDTQAEYDEIYQFISTNTSVTATNNTINITPTGAIVDYFHLLAIKPIFTKPMDLVVVSATNATPVVITFNKKSMLRSGSGCVFSGATNNAIINGTRYLRQINDYKYALYSDPQLITPIIGSGTLAGTVTTKMLFQTDFCTQYISGRKGTGFHIPTIFNPKFEIANGLIKIYPLEVQCSSVLMDYMKKPLLSQLPILDDVVIDLEQTYSIRFLYYWIDEVVKLYAEQQREVQMIQVQNQEIINP